MLRAQALFWLSTCLCVNVFCGSRIMGGQETSVEQYPYMAGLERWGWFKCGSTIIHKRWALTAGHCVTGTEDPKEIYLRVGTSHRESGGSTVPVYRAIKHSNQEENDIALLFTEYDFPLGDNVQIVALAEPDSDVEVGSTGTMMGWGRQAPNEASGTTLKTVEMTVVDREVCQSGTSVVPINEAFLCARPKNAGSDACKGDSGGPLVVGGVQVGIVRRARCSGDAHTMVMFANVGHFRQSIDSAMEWPPEVPPWNRLNSGYPQQKKCNIKSLKTSGGSSMGGPH